MDIHWYDLVGNFGVFLILLAYGLLQADKISSSSVMYSLLNAVGAALVLVSLMGAFNLAAFVLEAFWVLISVWGMISALTSQKVD